jgi:hypothetical protein
MSHRNITDKKIAKLRRALRKSGSTVPVWIDLIHYLKLHRHAQTTGEAKKIILAGRVKADSHTLGIKRVPMLVKGKAEDVDVVDPYVPARLRASITVLPGD